MQRSLDQAFSKYLQVTPIRIMLLHVDDSAVEERRETGSQQGFCLKSAVIKYLRGGPNGRATGNSIDFDTLQKLLIKNHAANFQTKNDK